MGRKWISVCLIVFMLFMIPMTTFADGFDNHRLGSISVTLLEDDGETPIQGAELSLYHVASVNRNQDNHLIYAYTDAFQACGSELKDPSLVIQLDRYVEELSISARKGITDGNGKITFADLPLGLYFVKQTNTVDGYAPCTSFLVTLPNEDATGIVYDVNASPKTEVEKLQDITIKKIWNTDPSKTVPDSVTVQLLLDGEVIETTTLSESNQWQVTYEDMYESDGYSILEVDVPTGYTATYAQKDYVFTVTNSSKLAQTGQLVWPIPILAVSGMVLIVFGTVMIRREREDHA